MSQVQDVVYNSIHNVTVYHDEIPEDFLGTIRDLLNRNLVRVEFDYDRTGTSKTGWIYRVVKLKDRP